MKMRIGGRRLKNKKEKQNWFKLIFDKVILCLDGVLYQFMINIHNKLIFFLLIYSITKDFISI